MNAPFSRRALLRATAAVARNPMPDARLHVRTDGALAALWWAPSLLLAVGTARAFSFGVDLRIRHARRLAAAGRHDAALRIYAAVRADIAGDLRQVRHGGVP